MRVGERGSTAWIDGVPEQGLPLLQDESMMVTVVVYVWVIRSLARDGRA